MIKAFVVIFFIIISTLSFGQFTQADTLRGSNVPARSWWNVLHYDISVTPDIDNRSLHGKVTILFSAAASGSNTMQVDLQAPMIIDSIIFENNKVRFTRKGNTAMVFLNDIVHQLYIDRSEGGKGVTTNEQSITIYYKGTPTEATNPPWDGGMVWRADKKNRPWITVACQGIGASIWFPCKDYLGDEPEYGSRLTVTIPDSLVCISNGKLRSVTKNNNKTKVWSWEVKNPINNYNIVPYIGKYVNFKEVYKGEKGNLEMNYWVLDYNIEKAKIHFKDAAKTMKAFEYWFGPYPFYTDGYKLIDAPHLGMEHQGAIAYGNNYEKGYSGRGDLSGSGWGLKWDYIIVHETGHEWFGNNITVKDIADMWVHESFTTYAEALFTEYYYGKKAASAYVTGQRKRVQHDKNITGVYGVNNEGSSDMYFKGTNLVHTLRQVIDDDVKFRLIMRGLNKSFLHQTVTGSQVEQYISKSSGKDLSLIFQQYLRTTKIPTLEYKIEKGLLWYRWINVVKGFNMPVKIMFEKGRYNFIYPTETFTQVKFSGTRLHVDENFYIDTALLPSL